MKRIIVNDTNIFVELLELGVLERFFTLPWEIYTTDFVMLELLREGLSEKVEMYSNGNLLKIIKFDEEELLNIIDFWQQYKRRTNMSLNDCSAWYFAKKHQFLLLTSNRMLEPALYAGEEVQGILYVIDQLIKESVLSKQIAISKIKLLGMSNPRLPKDEIEKRVKQWEKEIKEEGGSI